MSQEKSEISEKRGHTHVQWIFAILANTTTLIYGLQSGWTSPMTKVLQSDQSPIGVRLTDSEVSWIASIMCMVATVSVPIFVFIADRYGRRPSIQAIAIAQVLCWSTKLFATSTATLILARVFGGIAAGGCFNVVPIYVREIAQDNIRGALGSLLVVLQNIGILAMFVMGTYIDYAIVHRIVVVLPIATLVFLTRAPESPAFLVKIGRDEEATATLALLRGLDKNDKTVESEINCMKNELIYYKSLPAVTFYTIFKSKVWRSSAIIASTLIGLQAFNGSLALLTYASALLSSSGIAISPELQTLSVPIVLLLGSIVSLCSVEKASRKLILSATLLLTALSMIGLGTIMLFDSQGSPVTGWLPIIAFIVPVFAYGAGVSPMPYIIMSEMINFQIRAKVVGFVTTFGWLMSFLQLFAYAPVSASIGKHTTIYFFAIVNLLGAVYTLVFAPETKGKTAEEIEMELSKK